MAARRRAGRRRSVESAPPAAPTKEVYPQISKGDLPGSITRANGFLLSHKYTGNPPPPELGERKRFPCPNCGREDANATYSDRYGYPAWFIGCWSAKCQGLRGAPYLDLVKEATDAPSGYALLEDPRPYLARIASRSTRATGEPEELPSEDHLAGARERLWADANALAYLRGRGLADTTIRRAGIGYGRFHERPRAFMLPVRNRRGELRTLKERYWPEPWSKDGRPVWKRTLAGRGSHLCPALGDERKVVLAAGEMDALVAAQEFEAAGIEGAAVVTPTTGTQLRSGLLEEFAGRHVALVYDTGEEASALRNAARLVEAGAQAWAVPLGLPNEGDDLTDWWVTYGRTADELLELIREARRAAR